MKWRTAAIVALWLVAGAFVVMLFPEPEGTNRPYFSTAAMGETAVTPWGQVRVTDVTGAREVTIGADTMRTTGVFVVITAEISTTSMSVAMTRPVLHAGDVEFIAGYSHGHVSQSFLSPVPREITVVIEADPAVLDDAAIAFSVTDAAFNRYRTLTDLALTPQQIAGWSGHLVLKDDR